MQFPYTNMVETRSAGFVAWCTKYLWNDYPFALTVFYNVFTTQETYLLLPKWLYKGNVEQFLKCNADWLDTDQWIWGFFILCLYFNDVLMYYLATVSYKSWN